MNAPLASAEKTATDSSLPVASPRELYTTALAQFLASFTRKKEEGAEAIGGPLPIPPEPNQ